MAAKAKKEPHVNYMSLLSVLAAFFVVMLHCNGAFWSFSTEPYWKSANMIECIGYFAVPVFFMISGATLIDYQDRYTTRQYFSKRIQKTLIPFLVWSIIGMFWCMTKYAGGWVTWDKIDIWYILLGVMGCNFVSIYWFFPAIFGVYLSIPLFAAVEKDKRKTIFIYLAVAAFVFNILLPFIQSLSKKTLVPSETQVRVMYTYLFYIVVGYLIHKNEMNWKLRVVIYIAGIAGLLTHMIGTYELSMEAGSVVSTYKGYTNLPTVCYSIAIFVLFKQIGPVILKVKPIHFLIAHLGDYTFSIYLMHWFVMVIIRTEMNIDSHLLSWRLGGCIPIIAICVAVAFLLKRIPLLKRIVP